MATSPAKPVVVVDRVPVDTSYDIAVLVEVLDEGNVVATIDIDGGSVTIDRQAESRSTMEVQVANPDLVPTSATSLLAPFGNELRISRGAEFYDHIEVVRLGVFRIDDNDVDDDGTMDISGVDRSGRFIDHSFENPGMIEDGTPAEDALLEILRESWPDMPADFMPTGIDLPAIHYEEQDGRWELVTAIATVLSGDLYFDRSGTLLLRPIPTAVAGNPVAQLTEGEDGVLLNANRRWDRGPVYNKVIVTSDGFGDGSADQVPRGEATDTHPYSPTRWGSKFGRKPFFYSNSMIRATDLASANQQCKDAAEGILAKVTGAPDAVSFGSLVDPALDPSKVVRIQRDEIAVDEDHVLDSVTIPLTAEEAMTGNTRATQQFTSN